MKRVSSWIGMLTLAFWGVVIIRIVVHRLPPEWTQFVVDTGVPLAVIAAGLALFVSFRRRSVRRQTSSLEELRRQSRVRLAGEPIEGTFVVTPSRKRRGEGCCEKEGAGHAVREQQAAGPVAQNQRAEETQE